MKKIIVCCADEWTKELLTLARLESIEYFVDDNKMYTRGGQMYGKHVYGYDKLQEENKNDVILIISNSKRYAECAEKLQSMGFVENVHFFNGWKLHKNFYKNIEAFNTWQDDELQHDEVFANQAWEERAAFMAAMIPDDVHSLMDIGCGDQKLRKYIRDDVKYYGLDYTDRGRDSIVCDLNKEHLPKIEVDLYYLAGVFCYIHSQEKFLREMSGAKYVLISLRPTDQYIRLDGHLSNMAFEAPQYMSNDEVITCMYEEGFVLINAKYDYFFQNCHFYLFKKIKS